jgi:hypothetical protein
LPGGRFQRRIHVTVLRHELLVLGELPQNAGVLGSVLKPLVVDEVE